VRGLEGFLSHADQIVPEGVEVDTTDGYRPGLDQVVAFVKRPGLIPASGDREGA
jgi:hypothetical protein